MALKGSATSRDRPAVSVIIPAWNAGLTIRRALESALADPGVDLECIVVDDGSTDGTAAVAGDVAARDRRVVVVRLPVNGGPSAARNRALEVCRGEWLAFLDADDRFLDGGVRALLDAGRRSSALAVIGQRIWSDGARTWLGPEYDIPDIRRPGTKSLVANPGLLFYAAPTGKLFHRSITSGLRFEGRVLGDQPWSVRALIRAVDRIEVIGDTIYEWTRPADERQTSITAAKFASARRAAEAARVAVDALAQVRAEGFATLPPDAAELVTRAYFERLVKSDMAGPVRRAVRRGDAGTDELFDAIREFIVAAPPGFVAGSATVADRILHPVLDGWLLLRGDARRAFRRLVAAALEVDPTLPRHFAGPGVLRTSLRLLARSDGTVPAMLATAGLILHAPIALLERPGAALRFWRRGGR